MRLIGKTPKYVLLLSIIVVAASYVSAQDASTPNEIPTVSFCELVAHPEAYDQKVVRVSVVYLAAFEGSIMREQSCKDALPSWVEFDASYKSKTDRKVFKRFSRLTDTSPVQSGRNIDYPDRTVRVTWVGKFYGVLRTETVGSITRKRGYGHMGSYLYKFTVLKIDAVEEFRYALNRRHTRSSVSEGVLIPAAARDLART